MSQLTARNKFEITKIGFFQKLKPNNLETYYDSKSLFLKLKLVTLRM